MDINQALAQSLIQLGDDQLILGHRLSQWCGHAPMLEEDLSMPNMALDLIGQASNLYAYAGKLEGKGRDEDKIAYLRTDRQYQNILLVERPNADFAHTILRQLYFAAFMKPYWEWIAHKSQDEKLAGYAAKGAKEVHYHVRHCGEWVVRLGDGTSESASRMKQAVEAFHPYCEELFTNTRPMQMAIEAGILPDRNTMRDEWNATIKMIFDEALLDVPEIEFPQSGGREGLHGEDFGYLLAELQYMQRAYPDMTW